MSQIDFSKLTAEQKQVIIDRLCSKFENRDIGLKNLALFISLFRKKRYESGVIKILEGDEILKGRLYGVSKEAIQREKEKAVIVKEPVIPENKEIDETGYIEDEDIQSYSNNLSPREIEELEIARENRKHLNELRRMSTGDMNIIPSKSNIIFDDNIEQVESGYTLREINQQLPAENLLDRYNFGYVNLHDDDDELKRDSVGNRLK